MTDLAPIMNAKTQDLPIPVIEVTHATGQSAVTVRGLTPAMVKALSRHLDEGNPHQSVLSTKVGGSVVFGDDLPAVSGRYRLLED
jgi:hypothetical protein